MITNSDSLVGTFEVNPEQYTATLKGSKVPLTLPVRGSINFQSKRYSLKKPALSVGRFIHFTGKLTRIDPGVNGEDEGRFCVEVEEFDFLGYGPPQRASPATPTGSDMFLSFA